MSKFFHLNFKILKLSGLWVPDKKQSNYKTLILYNSICITYSIILFSLAELLALRESAKNLNDLIKNLNMSMSFILTSFKVLVWFYYRKDLLKITKLLEENSSRFKDYNFDSADIISKEKLFKDLWTKSFFLASSLVSVSAGFLSTTEALTSGEKYVEFKNGSQYFYNQKLPYYSLVPFDQTSSKLAYIKAVVYQCLALLSCGYITVGLDMMFVAIMSLTNAHFILLKNAFRRIGVVRIERLNITSTICIEQSTILRRACENELNKCIKHLQMLIRICQSLENIYSPVVLMQVLISLVVLCTCLYQVSSIPFGAKLLGNDLAYLLAIEIQVVVYCYVGSKLTHSALDIPSAIYESNWLTASLTYKKTMIITMMRMQKPIHITIGKFSPLTLNTFLSIGKMSYSIFTMLKSRN
nr:odorant receptor 27 [Holotrichia oblita]